MADKLHVVAVPLAIAKSAEGSDLYLYKGAPAVGLAEGELERLIEGDFVTAVEVASETPAESEEPFKGVTIPDLKAEIDKRNEGRKDEDKIVPAGANRPDLVAALVADDAKSSN